MKYVALCLLLFSIPICCRAQDDGIDEEKAIKIFSYLLDGAPAAKVYLADLRRIAADTPYKPLTVLGVARQLLVLGWKPVEAKTIISASANAGAGIGADDDHFAQIALLVGRLTDDEQSTYATLSGLEDEGIPIWQMMGRLIGKSPEQTKKLSLQRRLIPKIMAEALIAGFNETYAGAAEREARKSKDKAPSTRQ